MQFLHTVYCFIFKLFIFLFSLLLLVLAKKMLFVLSLVPPLKQQFNELINEKSQTNRDQKLNL